MSCPVFSSPRPCCCFVYIVVSLLSLFLQRIVSLFVSSRYKVGWPVLSSSGLVAVFVAIILAEDSDPVCVRSIQGGVGLSCLLFSPALLLFCVLCCVIVVIVCVEGSDPVCVIIVIVQKIVTLFALSLSLFVQKIVTLFVSSLSFVQRIVTLFVLSLFV